MTQVKERVSERGLATVARERNQINPGRWWAWAGALSILMFAYLVAAWFISGDATPTRAHDVGTSTKIWAWSFQILSPVLLIWCFVYAIRRSRRDGRAHLD